MSGPKESPLDELRVPADLVWDKIDAGDSPSDAEIAQIVAYERAAREEHIRKARDKETRAKK